MSTTRESTLSLSLISDRSASPHFAYPELTLSVIMGDRLDPARLVDATLTIRLMNAPHALAAKRCERRLVCRADENGTVADLRTMLVRDSVIGANDVFIIDGGVVGRSSESVTKWRSVLKDKNVIIPQTLILLCFAREERTAPPSTLATARIIDDLSNIPYPEGIKGPQARLNMNAKSCRFRYDRNFLLQFMAVCKERPDSLPPLESLGLDPSENTYPLLSVRKGSNQGHLTRHLTRHLSASASCTQQVPSGGMGAAKKSANLPKSSAQIAGHDIQGPLEELTEGRFESVCKDGPDNHYPLEPLPLDPKETTSRTRSARGKKGGQSTSHPSASASQTQQVSSGVMSAAKKSTSLTEGSAQTVGQDIEGLLKQLTEERFGAVSDQIIAWVNKLENPTDTLIEVVQPIFHRATDGTASSEICARLSRKMTDTISLEVRDNKDTNGRPISGGQLFRKYLLGHCRDYFEHTLASKKVVKAGLVRSEDQIADTTPTDQKACRDAPDAMHQDLGLIKFASELFKVQIINERIMHDKYVKTLLGDTKMPTEETAEGLFELFTTAGAMLDTRKSRRHMDVYVSRMKVLAKSPRLSSHAQALLEEVIALRERNWVPRDQIIEPAVNTVGHKYQQQHGSKGAAGPSGQTAVDRSPTRAFPKAGDLSNFGKNRQEHVGDL